MDNSPAVFTGFGIRFLYPSNWELFEEQTDEWPISLTVQSPGTAFWSLSLYRQLLPTKTLADEFLEAMRGEYPELEASPLPSREDLDSHLAYELNFYCQERLAAGKAEIFDHQALTLVILMQGEDREFDRLQPVLDAITESLFRKPQGVA